MPLQIVRNDITKMAVDAIVNTTNPSPAVGYGVDTAIHNAAGPQLLAARKGLGVIPVGSAGVTPAYGLDAKYVLHTVTPVWQGGNHHEPQLLRQCYTKCLYLAMSKGCQSIAFPLMSAGNHGFPKPMALQAATAAITQFLMENDMDVYLVVFSKDAFQLSEKLFHGVESFIDEHYIDQAKFAEYDVPDKCNVRMRQVQETLQLQEAMVCPSMATPPEDLEMLLRNTDEGFSATLLKLIDRTGEKDSAVYKRANVSRKLFSKIKNTPNYTPSKPTVLAFCIALRLDLPDTKMLLSRAGYALNPADKTDIIVEYFIRTKNYNIFELNEVLFYYDRPTIGV